MKPFNLEHDNILYYMGTGNNRILLEKVNHKFEWEIITIPLDIFDQMIKHYNIEKKK